MMKCKILFTANAGFLLEAGGKTILIDALHNTPVGGWSALDESKTAQLFALLDRNPPDILYFTHVHPDHFSKELAETAAERAPGCRLILPKRESKTEFSCGDVCLQWAELPHMHVNGKYAGTNFCLTIRCRDSGKPSGEAKIFVSGDVDFTSSKTLAAIDGLAPDLAFLNFPWISLRAGREALEKLSPGKVVLVHLPYPEDDAFGYIPAAKRSAEQFFPDAVPLTEFFQQVEIEI